MRRRHAIAKKHAFNTRQAKSPTRRLLRKSAPPGSTRSCGPESTSICPWRDFYLFHAGRGPEGGPHLLSVRHGMRQECDRSATDPKLKGRWTDPPAGKWPFFGVLELRRIGASRCLSVAPGCASVDSTKRKSRFFFWRVWAGFLSPASHVIFGTAHSWPIQQPAFGLSGLVLNTKPKSGLFFCCIGPEHHRLEPRGY